MFVFWRFFIKLTAEVVFLSWLTIPPLSRSSESVSDGQAGCQQQADVCAQSADRLAAAGRGQAEVSAWLDELSKLLDGPAPATEAGQVAQRADQLQVRNSRETRNM